MWQDYGYYKRWILMQNPYKPYEESPDMPDNPGDKDRKATK